MSDNPTSGRPAVSITNCQDIPVDDQALVMLASLVAESEGCASGTEIGIILVDEEEMAGLNLEAMGREEPTDVLSFPIEACSPGFPPVTAVDGPPVLLGDVVIAPSYVKRRAAELGEEFSSEMALMVTHGVLHLFGYEHETEADAEIMEARERFILAQIGVSRK